MRKLYVILLFFSLLFSISCNSYKYGANAEPTQKSNLTFGVVKSKIIKGNTTQSEILEIFGAPNLVSKNKSNNEVWNCKCPRLIGGPRKTLYTDMVIAAHAIA